MICVECGADVPKLIGGCCPACFAAKTPLLTAPPTLDLELCTHCDARHVGAHWVDPEEGDDLQWIRGEAARAAFVAHPRVRGADIQVVEEPQDERNSRYHGHLEGTVEGVPVAADATLLLRLKRANCDRCSRMFGGFYAAVLQLRGTGRDVTELELERAHRIVGSELDRQRASGNREAFLTKSGAVPGGFDYYLGDIEGARQVSRTVMDALGATVVETAKLVGRREGEDVFRVTFLIRIRPFATGDFALVGDVPVQVNTIDRGRAHVQELPTGRWNKVEETQLRRLGGWEILEEAVMVSRDGAAVQVLDPQSYRTVDVVPPEGWQAPAEGDPVWLLRHEERLFLAPTPPANVLALRRRKAKPPRATRQA